MRLESCAVRAAREVSVTDPAHPLHDSIQRHLGAILARKRLQLKNKQAEVEAKKKRVEQESVENTGGACNKTHREDVAS
jgi:hypothetical protein